MDDSPKGREIQKLVGDSSAIHGRGQQIEDLGEKMISSAALLKQLHDGADGQKGLAVDTLRGKVTDVYEELDKAGDRYKPTGPALKAYATALASVKPLVSTAVDDCVDTWATYESKHGAATQMNPLGVQLPDDDGDSGGKSSAEKYKDATNAADTARGEWEDAARRFDTHYDTWEEAFDTAADKIGDVTHGNIQDGFWDKVDGWVATALKVLSYVGIALAVLAIVIGGPIIAAIAAVVAVVTLALTIYQKIRGDAGWGAVIMAAVGVIPIGKLGVLFKPGRSLLGNTGKLMEFVKQSPLNLVKNGKTIVTETKAIVGAGRTASAFAGGGTKGIRAFLTAAGSRMNDEGTITGLNMALRAMTGSSTKGLEKIQNFGDALGLMYGQYGQAMKVVKYTKMAASDQ